jgi:hypothetical protein
MKNTAAAASLDANQALVTAPPSDVVASAAVPVDVPRMGDNPPADAPADTDAPDRASQTTRDELRRKRLTQIGRSIGLLVIGSILIGAGAGMWWLGSQGTQAITGMPLVGTTVAELLGGFVLIALFMRRGFIAALIWLLPTLPAIAAIAMIAAYLSGLAQTGAEAVYDGLLAMAIVWLAVGASTTDRTKPSGAQARAFAELQVRMDQLQGRLDVISEQVARSPELEEAKAALRRAREALDTDAPSAQWTSAIGYVNTWRALHRCEEAMIYVDSPEQVVAGALVDDLRLDGSAIPGRDRLVVFLREAVNEFDPEAGHRYLRIEGAHVASEGESDEMTAVRTYRARSLLREVRRAINDFRDARTEDIIKARNILRRTFAFAAVVGFSLLAVAVLVDTPPATIATATGLFLIAALVGLFSRLNNTNVGMSTVDDFGLDDAQLLAGPLVSGIAGIGGVILIAATPAAAAALSATAAAGLAPTVASFDFGAIFDLSRNPLAVVFAAVFGLTPSLLLSRLQDSTERLKKDLRSSYVADKSSEEGQRTS